MRCGNCGRGRGQRGCGCVPEWVWRDPEVVTAVRERDAQRVIQFLRRRVKGLSQEALARMCGVAQSTINRAESGAGLTDRRKAHRALQGLGAPLETDVPREQVSPKPLRAKRAPSRTAPGLPPSPWTARDDLSDLSLETFAHALAGLEQDYASTSSMAVLARIGPLHGQLSQSHPGAHRLRARSNLLMGQVLWDASQRREPHAATSHLTEAAIIAQSAGDHEVLAQALLRSSYIPLYGPDPDPQQALVTAHRAMISARESPNLRALAALHISEAYARLRKGREAQQMLEQADAAAGEAHEIDGDAWGGRRLRIAGSVFLELDQPVQARQMLEQAVLALTDRPKTCGIALANLALAHVRQREIEGAASALHHAMDLTQATHAGGATSLIASVVKELAPWRTEEVVLAVQDRFIDLLTR